MDLIRSVCNSVFMGGLELALQKPEKEMRIRTEPGKGTWQGGWQPDCRARRLRKGDVGNWKGSEGSS